MQSQEMPAIISVEKAPKALSQIGISADQVIQIAKAASFAKAEYLEGIDPLNAPGIKAYQAGIRQLRLETIPAGWKSSRFNNIEVVVNHDLGLMLGFQNVDRACENKSPLSISDRGEGTRELVARPYEPGLFNPERSETTVYSAGVTPIVWFICVAATKDKVQVEVSRPKPFDGKQFEGFFERIFVSDEKFEAPIAAAKIEPEQEDDHDFVITKKSDVNS